MLGVSIRKYNALNCITIVIQLFGRTHPPARTIDADIQIPFHGKPGCNVPTVPFNYPDSDSFVQPSILTGFPMILQNLLAVFIRQLYAVSIQTERNLRAVL